MTHDLSFAASRRFTLVLGETAGAACAWMRPPLRTQCVNLEVHLYYPAFYNLVYECGNVP